MGRASLLAVVNVRLCSDDMIYQLHVLPFVKCVFTLLSFIYFAVSFTLSI